MITSLILTAAATRLAGISLAFFSTLILTPFDRSNTFTQPLLSVPSPSPSPAPSPAPSSVDSLIVALFTPLSNWDAVHFLAIAQDGHVYEHQRAFFPGYPYSLYVLSRFVLEPLGLSRHAALLLAGVVLSNVSFVLCAVVLYKLGVSVTRDPDLSYRAALLFCVTPASVFFSAIYTESPFALFSFLGMLLLVHNRPWGATGSFFIACWLRSNGIILGGFLLYRQLFTKLKITFLGVLSMVLQLAVLAVPALWVQRSAVEQFCPGRPWCQGGSVYGFVQGEYWEVGLFRYYQWKQLPNFLFALPMAVVSLSLIGSYFSSDWRRVLTLGRGGSVGKGVLPNDALFVYVVHLAGLTAIGLAVMNVQVITRFLASSCPVVYWWLADRVMERPRVVLGYCVVYFGVGFVLFGNFYPWT